MSELEIFHQRARLNATSLLALIVIPSLLFLLPSGSIARELMDREVVARDIDHGLKNALASRDLDLFKQYLEEGADPTVWFENSHDGWVFCAATEKGLEAYLQLIIDKGFDVNIRQTDIYTTAQLPLTCAVAFHNFLALEMLISAGADPAEMLCPSCNSRWPGSVLDQAAIVGKYDLAVWLVDKGDYSYEQMQAVIYGIEHFPVDESNPRNLQRLELAERIREQGFEVNPWTKDKRSD